MQCPARSTRAGQLNHTANQWLPECASCLGHVHDSQKSKKEENWNASIPVLAPFTAQSCCTRGVRHQPRRADDVKPWYLPRAREVESVHEILLLICWRFLLVERSCKSYCSRSAVRHLGDRAYSGWLLNPKPSAKRNKEALQQTLVLVPNKSGQHSRKGLGLWDIHPWTRKNNTERGPVLSVLCWRGLDGEAHEPVQ